MVDTVKVMKNRLYDLYMVSYSVKRQCINTGCVAVSPLWRRTG